MCVVCNYCFILFQNSAGSKMPIIDWKTHMASNWFITSLDLGHVEHVGKGSFTATPNVTCLSSMDWFKVKFTAKSHI